METFTKTLTLKLNNATVEQYESVGELVCYNFDGTEYDFDTLPWQVRSMWRKEIASGEDLPCEAITFGRQTIYRFI
jgi:hypothetical protein